MAQIQASDLHGSSQSISFDVKPDECPICHVAVDPRLCGHAAVILALPQQSGAVLEIIFQCTKRECQHFFIGRYRRKTMEHNQMVGDFFLIQTLPKEIVEPKLAQEIIEVSSNFKSVFCQAAAAEATGLDQIAGVGYRKALEFLVKDYCIAQEPTAAESIKTEALGATISGRVSDIHVKECARRAAWLGNDETHYVRRWEDKDISDLKILIDLTMSWIRSSVLTKRYLNSMADGRTE